MRHDALSGIIVAGTSFCRPRHQLLNRTLGEGIEVWLPSANKSAGDIPFFVSLIVSITKDGGLRNLGHSQFCPCRSPCLAAPGCTALTLILSTPAAAATALRSVSLCAAPNARGFACKQIENNWYKFQDLRSTLNCILRHNNDGFVSCGSYI